MPFSVVEAPGDVPSLTAHSEVGVAGQQGLGAQTFCVTLGPAQTVGDRAHCRDGVRSGTVRLAPDWLDAFWVGFSEIVFFGQNFLGFFGRAVLELLFVSQLGVENPFCVGKHPFIEKIVWAELEFEPLGIVATDLLLFDGRGGEGVFFFWS